MDREFYLTCRKNNNCQGALFVKTAPWTPTKAFVNKSFYNPHMRRECLALPRSCVVYRSSRWPEGPFGKVFGPTFLQKGGPEAIK